jgi:putative ABC transport system permease protein
VVYQQLNFMQQKDLGYDKDQVLIINDSHFLRNEEIVFKEQLLDDSRVINASIARHMPSEKDMRGTQAFPKDQAENESNSEIHINIYNVDYDYLATLGITLTQGRNLSRDFPSDSSAIIINETAARKFGWTPERAIGKSIIVSGQTEYHVVGVVNDFHYASVRQEVAPLVMMLRYNSGSILVKLNAKDIQGFVNDVKKQWVNFNSEIPFSYSFLDEKFASLYIEEERTGKLFTTFAVIAILIAAMGLYGLSAFSAEQRVREIGIRKVFGASTREVLFMLSKQFLSLVSIAFVLAIPVVIWVMNWWLEDFAYRVTLAWWFFLVAGIITFMIAFMSMCFQVFKVALSNPMKSLKSE